MNSPAQKRALFLLWLSLMCCVFEGAARKWLVGDASVWGRVAYLSKDIVMAAFLIQYRVSTNWLATIARPFLYWGLGLLTAGALFSSLSGINPIGSVLTVRTFILLPAAAWAAGCCLPPDALRRYARWACVLAILICPLAVRQFYSPPGSAINRYSTEGEGQVATSGISQRVRATGTFSYITGMGEFATLGVWAGIIVFSMAQARYERWLGYVGLVAALCCALVTVSRAVAMMSIALVGTWALFGGQVGRKVQAIGVIAMAMWLGLAATDAWQEASEITSTVYLRHESSNDDSIAFRLWYQFVLPLQALDYAPLGNGLGSEQAGRTVDAEMLRSGSTFESPWGRTVMELGIIGFFGFLISLGGAFVPCRAWYLASPDATAKIIRTVTGIALAMRAALGFQFNHVASYFFWSMAACILASGNVAREQSIIVKDTKRSLTAPVSIN
jgi:hypothetical protein